MPVGDAVMCIWMGSAELCWVCHAHLDASSLERRSFFVSGIYCKTYLITLCGHCGDHRRPQSERDLCVFLWMVWKMSEGSRAIRQGLRNFAGGSKCGFAKESLAEFVWHKSSSWCVSPWPIGRRRIYDIVVVGFGFFDIEFLLECNYQIVRRRPVWMSQNVATFWEWFDACQEHEEFQSPMAFVGHHNQCYNHKFSAKSKK